MQDSEGNFTLCDELLIKILRYAGKSRKTAKLVCKKFLGIICDIDKHEELNLDREKLENDEAYTTIMNSQRKFGEIWIHSHENHSLEFYERLKHICMRHGANVKQLIWEPGHACPQSTFTEILGLMPNLLELYCHTWKLTENYLPDQTIDFKLKNLKHVEFISCEAPIAQMVDNLLEENSLNELIVCPDFIVKDILLRQGNIEKIELTRFDAEDFQCVGLKELTLHPSFDDIKVDDFKKLLAKHPEITELKLQDFFRELENDPAAFINMCHLKLTRLKIFFHEVDETAFKNNFWRLTDLTQLEICFQGIGNFKSLFLKMKFPQLKKLKLWSYSELSCAELRSMGENLPALEKVKFCYCALQIHDVLKHLTNLTSVGFSYVDHTWDGEHSNSRIKKVYFSKFRNASLYINLNELLLLKIMHSFPDLRSLKYFHLYLPLKIKLLDDILRSLPHLHTLKCLIFVQRGDDYEEFTEKSAFELKRFVKEIPVVCVKVKVKDTKMDEAKLKDILGNYLYVLTDAEDCKFLIKTEKCDKCCYYPI